MPFAKVLAKKIKCLNADAQAKFMSAENAMIKEIKDKIEANFDSSNTNKNSILKEFDFFDFFKKILANWKDFCGDEVEFNKELVKETYFVLNQISPDVDGISK